jgi:hypothetical protein
MEPGASDGARGRVWMKGWWADSSSCCFWSRALEVCEPRVEGYLDERPVGESKALVSRARRVK